MIQSLLVEILYYNYCCDYYPLDELLPIYSRMLEEKYNCIEKGIPLQTPHINYKNRTKIYVITVGPSKYTFTPNMVKLNDGELYSINEVANMSEKEFSKYLT